ncbi:unnamed protein product (mitochondrion) [Plasmodiophora brassicae]|uniref:Phosphoglycerate dehydrogenase n=1 Tax=Plasmodiophora brassicae TaxID=37360 RepID=A0A0G4J6D6_PLABS|nr:hypothetical protein PBRA_009356 [Plasmodiophora brassicae]SPR01158.1 unnamed protein product [Plasmodiophora brassicae]
MKVHCQQQERRASPGEMGLTDVDDGPVRRCYGRQEIRVLLLENVSQKAVDVFVGQGFDVEAHAKLSEKEIVDKIGRVNVIGVRSKTKLTPAILRACKRNGPVAIGCFCIGTDQTDLDVAGQLGIPVFNAPFANTRSVAEIVMGNIIALARGVGDCNSAMHRGTWTKSASNKFEVRGKTLGIVGYGHVGSQLSVIAEALGMKVIFYDIDRVMAIGNATPVATQEQLLNQADFVSLHVPLTPLTTNMITAVEIGQMKQGASFLINYARGKCVDVNAVADALKSGVLLGAAFDVFPTEPASGEPFKNVLQGCPNTILTPHIGGSTEEAQSAIGVEVANKLVDFIATGNSDSAVNFPHIGLPYDSTQHRILNVHRNVPGVLREINSVLGDYNISSQVLGTSGSIGYMICHTDTHVAQEVFEKVAALPNSIRTRIIEQD